jgi:hypothetical protein
MKRQSSLASIKYSGQCAFNASVICWLHRFETLSGSEKVHGSGIIIRRRRLSNTLILLELVSSIFLIARLARTSFVVDVMPALKQLGRGSAHLLEVVSTELARRRPLFRIGSQR